jgi:lipopolysaccharide biosynthesis protein
MGPGAFRRRIRQRNASWPAGAQAAFDELADHLIESGDMARVIAFYLPQFHPIPENDQWWGKGFTEWTNVAKAQPLFPGHYQPHVPADLGFYDLRVAETRQDQASMALEFGVDAFCYYHYWFAGRRLLERPFNEVLNSGRPDFPFCLCWANQSWSGVWHGAPDRVLIEQTYPGYDDHARHFDWLAKAFSDRRYVTVAGKPLLVIFNAHQIPSVNDVMEFWRRRAAAAGLPGLHLVAIRNESVQPPPGESLPAWNPESSGFDAVLRIRVPLLSKRPGLAVIDHNSVVDYLVAPPLPGTRDYPCVGHAWDSTPRSGQAGIVFQGSTPELFRRNLRQAFAQASAHDPEEQIVFLKAWNEWAEGNHLEPDLKFGHAWLEALRDERASARF